MIKRLFLNEAFNLAQKSDMNFNHGCVVVYRGRIIGRGYNTYIDSNFNQVSIHAEVSAIDDALKRVSAEELKKCELIVIRINKTAEYCLPSKPCCNCSRYINKFKIKKVFHS